MKIYDYIAQDEASMEALARRLAPCLKAGDVLALRGELGAGKTTLARALIRALLGRDVDVPSPTFTLVQTYDGPGFPISHFDLYRLSRPEDIEELGWEESLAEGLVIVEWPERLAALPTDALLLDIGFAELGRRIIFSGKEEWQERIKIEL